jgi:hypothetical protein
MTDPTEEILAPAVIERAMSVFESLRERNHYEIVQARKALTPHVFELIGTGQKDEQRLVVSALTYLKAASALSMASWRHSELHPVPLTPA